MERIQKINSAEVVDISEIRALREQRYERAAAELGFTLDLEVSQDKIITMQTALKKLDLIIKDPDVPKKEQRVAYYISEAIAEQLSKDIAFVESQTEDLNKQFIAVPADRPDYALVA
jgi:hypothetical protein